MLIQKDGAASVGSDQEYEADKDGVIEVPAELGEVLVRTHGFVEVIPEPDAPARPAKAAKAAEPTAGASKETAAAKKKRLAEEAKAAKAAEPTAGVERDRSDGIDHGVKDAPAEKSDDEGDSGEHDEDAAE